MRRFRLFKKKLRFEEIEMHTFYDKDHDEDYGVIRQPSVDELVPEIRERRTSTIKIDPLLQFEIAERKRIFKKNLKRFPKKKKKPEEEPAANSNPDEEMIQADFNRYQ